MTCPAELTFKRDRVLKPTARRLYDFLFTDLDFRQVRERKVGALAEAIGVDRKSARHALRELLAGGYVIAEGRGERGTYRLTLAWSVHTEQH